jgi:peptidoglycan/LPS O-acetylase OafA/YrhL
MSNDAPEDLMKTSPTRLYGADFIRASACFIVLFHHLAQRIDFRSALGSNPFAQVFNTVGGLGVAMFFVLSGFLLARPFWQALDAGRAMPSLRVYALRRAARIVPGFWLALTATFILSVTVFGATLDGWLWLRYAAGLLLLSDWHWTTLFPVEVNGPLWSIGFEVSAYVMLPLGFFGFFALGKGRLRGWPARLAWLAVIAVALGAHWLFYNNVHVDPYRKGWEFGLQGGAKTWMPWFNPFGFFAMFATGALAAGVQVSLARFRSIIFDGAAVVALGAAGWLIWSNGLRGGGEFYGWLRVPYQFPSFHLLIGAVLATAPSGLLVGRLLDNPLVAWLARISFGIYVWHYLVLELVRLYWVPEIAHGTMADGTKFLVASAVITVITMVVASLSWRWLELPVINWARQREMRGDPEPAPA